jgi:glutamate racemase
VILVAHVLGKARAHPIPRWKRRVYGVVPRALLDRCEPGVKANQHCGICIGFRFLEQAWPSCPRFSAPLPQFPATNQDGTSDGTALATFTMTAPTILVFDSGLGGLTVFREIVRARPDGRFIYVADDAFFPYGAHNEQHLIGRVVPLFGELIALHRPDLIVIACNTASTLVLPHLRAAYPLPFVGTVPAIKPACASSKTRRVSVLGTKATVAREYTRTLIRDFAGDCEVTLVGAAQLAPLVERALRDEAVRDEEIAAEIAPAFRDGPQRTDTVVLACTHFPLLLDRLQALAPWPVKWVDPAPAIARRVVDLIGPPQADALTPARAIFTSGRPPSPALKAALSRFGIGNFAAAAAI